jgi:hypothetical protein
VLSSFFCLVFLNLVAWLCLNGSVLNLTLIEGNATSKEDDLIIQACIHFV